jgi:pyrroloquinoline quinone (PQQ) biosynthesis protein C
MRMISDVLRNDIDDYARALRQSPLLEDARAGRVTPAVVGRYLASIHYLLTQTPIHLALAQARALEHGRAGLVRYYEQKLLEEQGHHHWAEADQSRLAELFGEAAVQEPAPTMIALVRNTRAIIERDPVLYLAYILFAEYFMVVMGPEWLRALDEHCGIPASAMTAVSHHVELDKHHVAEGCREMDALIEDDRLHEPMRQALRDTMRHFSAFCDDLRGLAA